MNSSEFTTWRTTHLFIEDDLFYPDGENFHWGRIHATWHEKQGAIDLTHHCAFAVDLQNGNLYLDCRKRKIWTKCVLLTLFRPLFGVYKTVYHLTLPLSIPIEIFKAIWNGVQQRQSCEEIGTAALRNVKNNFADLVRTPLYTIAITIVTLEAVLIGPFAPHRLYDLRALAGRLEASLNRGEGNFWTLASCFKPIGNVKDIHLRNYKKNDTQYDANPTLHGINNLVRSFVKHRRKVRSPFDDYGMLLDKNTPFNSAIYA